MDINRKKLNPIAFHLINLMQNPNIRIIINYGGSSSGKSYSIAQMILIFTIWEGSNTLVMRKVGASIGKTIYEDFKVAARQLGIYRLFRFKDGTKQIVCLSNEAKIDFGGLDDPEKIKGISNYKRVFLDEWNEFDEADYKQVRKRLRGKKGQQILTAFNPISEKHWIKTNVFDMETWHDIPMDVEIDGEPMPPELTEVKSIRMNEPKWIKNPRTKELEVHAPDTVVIQSTYLNNFWVVGSPDGTYGYYDEQCIADFEKDRLHDPIYYSIYALAEWGVIQTGSEFFGSFNRGVHCSDVAYNPDLPIHVSVDNNVLPYISYTFWQVDTESGTHIRQIDEVCAVSPDNTARKSAKLVAEKLMGYGVDRIILHGDASTRAANTIDDEKRSFLDLVIDSLQKGGIEVDDKVGSKNPSVPMSGEFINAILDKMLPGLTITIGDNCKSSIDDYMSVQKDVNGSILKNKVKNKTTMQTYEEHGHLSDTFRYLVCDVLKDEFTLFSNRRKRNLYAKDGAINFFNPATDCKYTEDIVYLLPNINGRFVMLHGRMCGDKWHIVSVAFRETSSTEEIRQAVLAEMCGSVVVECGQAYYSFVRGLRDDVDEARIYKEATDIDRRISATSDYVRSNILFSESELNGNPEYALFMSNLLDYRKDGQSKEASAALSGFIKYVIKSFS